MWHATTKMIDAQSFGNLKRAALGSARVVDVSAFSWDRERSRNGSPDLLLALG